MGDRLMDNEDLAWQRMAADEFMKPTKKPKDVSSALKPCPFCSSVNLHLKSGYLKPGASWDVLWYVKCLDCVAHGGYRAAKPDAIESWNMRDGKCEHNRTLLE